MSISARSGYTLPVFACGAAIAALRWLQTGQPERTVSLDLIHPSETAEIAIDQVAGLGPDMALAITRSDPGDNLDLTRDTPVWAVVRRADANQREAIILEGGEGIGRITQAENRAAIYRYAQELLQTNLERLLAPSEKIQVTLILPEGRSLAARTSNAAFGVVAGLSLLGTSGISQPLSAPEQLEVYLNQLRQAASSHNILVFCVGENGLDLGQKWGLNSACLIKTANWIGSMLVEASLQRIEGILLLGYHGKLIKLAGGIFHTHHHLADARQEILTAHCANLGLPHRDLQAIFASPTTEAGLAYLRELDETTGSQWVQTVYQAIAEQIDQRSQVYIQTHTERILEVGSILFDRQRQIITISTRGKALLQQLAMA